MWIAYIIKVLKMVDSAMCSVGKPANSPGRLSRFLVDRQAHAKRGNGERGYVEDGYDPATGVKAGDDVRTPKGKRKTWRVDVHPSV